MRKNSVSYSQVLKNYHQIYSVLLHPSCLQLVELERGKYAQGVTVTWYLQTVSHSSSLQPLIPCVLEKGDVGVALSMPSLTPSPRVAEFFQNSNGISSNINTCLVSAYQGKKWKKKLFWPYSIDFSIFGRIFWQILVFIIYDQLRISIQICYYTQIKANCKL